MPHEPKKRHSRQRQGKRRASIKLALPTLVICKNCGNTIEPHTVCKACGYYKNVPVFVRKERSKDENKLRPQA